jgi:hypothetical protein
MANDPWDYDGGTRSRLIEDTSQADMLPKPAVPKPMTWNATPVDVAALGGAHPISSSTSRGHAPQRGASARRAQFRAMNDPAPNTFMGRPLTEAQATPEAVRAAPVAAMDVATPAVRMPRRTRADRGAEVERKQRLGEIDSAIWELGIRGGGVNMRSKRELLSQLIGAKNDLTQGRMKQSTDIGLANAGIEAGAYREQAGIEAEVGTRNADRRAQVDMGNAENAARNAPSLKDILEAKKLALQLQRDTAGEVRDNEKHEATIEGEKAKYDDEAMARYAAAGRDPRALIDARIANGEDPRGSRTSSDLYDADLESIRERMNDQGWGDWAGAAAAGDYYVSGDKPQVAPAGISSYDQLEVEDVGGVYGLFTDKKKVKTKGTAGRYSGDEAFAYVEPEEAERIRLNQERMRRRSGQ